jgi:hypothetical protein
VVFYLFTESDVRLPDATDMASICWTGAWACLSSPKTSREVVLS